MSDALMLGAHWSRSRDVVEQAGRAHGAFEDPFLGGADR
jgi:hypothetical protein